MRTADKDATLIESPLHSQISPPVTDRQRQRQRRGEKWRKADGNERRRKMLLRLLQTVKVSCCHVRHRPSVSHVIISRLTEYV